MEQRPNFEGNKTILGNREHIRKHIFILGNTPCVCVGGGGGRGGGF